MTYKVSLGWSINNSTHATSLSYKYPQSQDLRKGTTCSVNI